MYVITFFFLFFIIYIFKFILLSCVVCLSCGNVKFFLLCFLFPCNFSLGEQLKINQPHIYDCSIPASLAAAVPAMAQLCKHTLGRWDNTSSPPSNRSISLLSLAGTEFISFAKGASFANGKTRF